MAPRSASNGSVRLQAVCAGTWGLLVLWLAVIDTPSYRTMQPEESAVTVS